MLAALLTNWPRSSGYRRLMYYMDEVCEIEKPAQAECKPLKMLPLYEEMISGADIDGLDARVRQNKEALSELIDAFLDRQEKAKRPVSKRWTKKATGRIIKRLRVAGVKAPDIEIEAALSKLRAARIEDEEETFMLILLALT